MKQLIITTLLAILQNRELAMGLIVWPLVTLVTAVMARKKSPEQWEQWALSKPGFALVIEVMRGLGIDPPKVMQAFRRYAQRKAGVVPADAIRVSSLPDPIKKALQDPKNHQMLMDLLARTTAEPTPSSEPVPAPVPPSQEGG
jgi:hypothetical protein